MSEKKKLKKPKWKKKKFEGKNKLVGRMQRAVGEYVKGTTKKADRVEIK